MRKAFIALALLGALILAACGQQTTEKQGIKINARDGAQITRFDVQKGEDGITTVFLDWN